MVDFFQDPDLRIRIRNHLKILTQCFCMSLLQHAIKPTHPCILLLNTNKRKKRISTLRHLQAELSFHGWYLFLRKLYINLNVDPYPAFYINADPLIQAFKLQNNLNVWLNKNSNFSFKISSLFKPSFRAPDSSNSNTVPSTGTYF